MSKRLVIIFLFMYFAVLILFIEHMLGKVREFFVKLFQKHHPMQLCASHRLSLLMK